VVDYLVYELQEDGTSARAPITISAENDADAYIEAARIASPENWVVEVWRGPLLVWHLEPSPGKRPRSFVGRLIGEAQSDLCSSAV
jgi:hypothetical protein